MVDHTDSFAFDIERRNSNFRPRAVPLRFDLKIMFMLAVKLVSDRHE
jgi:hypothetical protein